MPGTFPLPTPRHIPQNLTPLLRTWFNKIGNREMYMNCAIVTISGSGAEDGIVKVNEEAPPDRKSTRLNSSHKDTSRMPSSA